MTAGPLLSRRSAEKCSNRNEHRYRTPGCISRSNNILNSLPLNPSSLAREKFLLPFQRFNAGVDAIPAGTIIPAALSKSVDAKKAKPGDKIEARITMDLLCNGKVVTPRDTKVIGHVTEA